MSKKTKKVSVKKVKRSTENPYLESLKPVAEIVPPKRYLVCCGHTTKRVGGGRRCQMCHGFVAS